MKKVQFTAYKSDIFKTLKNVEVFLSMNTFCSISWKKFGKTIENVKRIQGKYEFSGWQNMNVKWTLL